MLFRAASSAASRFKPRTTTVPITPSLVREARSGLVVFAHLIDIEEEKVRPCIELLLASSLP